MSCECPDTMTLAEARDWLRQRVRDGHTCPLCRQYAKVYKRKINSGIARALIVLARASRDGEFVHKPTVLGNLGGSGARDESIARYWGLLEEEAIVRPDRGRAGYWRVTALGREFVHCEAHVPKYALIYDARCIGLEGDPVTIRACLSDKFDYDELMHS